MDELRVELELGKLIDKQAQKNGSSEERKALWAAGVRACHARLAEEYERRAEELCED
jgi:hypothetical protein